MTHFFPPLYGKRFIVCLLLGVLGTQLRAAKKPGKLVYVHNFAIPDSNIVFLERIINAAGSIGVCLPKDLLFVARGGVGLPKGGNNPKGRLFNLMSAKPSVDAFLIEGDDGKRIRVHVYFDTKYKDPMHLFVTNHEGTMILGASNTGVVNVWVKKITPPSEKKIDHIFKRKETFHAFPGKPIRLLRIATDDEHLCVLPEKAKQISVWEGSFSQKPAIYQHDTTIESMDFHPLSPTNFVMGDACGRILFMQPRTPNLYNRGLMVYDSIRVPNNEPIDQLYYSTSGQHVLAFTKNTNLYIFNDRTRDLYVAEKHIHDSTITGVTFLKEPNFFLTASLDKTVKLWSLEMGKSLFSLRFDSTVTGVSSSATQRFFLVFDKRDAVRQYFFNDYMLNSLFVLHNIRTDLTVNFRAWQDSRQKASEEQFMKLSSLSYLKSRFLRVVREGINKYATMAFYKNMVTLKTSEYDEQTGRMACVLDGFEDKFLVKIPVKDTNVFKLQLAEGGVQIKNVEAKIADDGGIILDKGEINVKDLTFHIVPNTQREPQEEPFVFAFTIDSMVSIHLSSWKNVQIDSVNLSPLLYSADVDTFNWKAEGQFVAHKQKAVFIGLAWNKYKQKTLKYPFGVNDLASVSAQLGGLLAIPKANHLERRNLNADKLKTFFQGTAQTKADIAKIVAKKKPPELYIYISGISQFDEQTQKDYLLANDWAEGTDKRIAWADIVEAIAALGVKKINIIVDSDVQNKNVFLAGKINVLVLQREQNAPVYDRNLFHNLFAYAFLRTIADREIADRNRNKVLNFKEIQSYMQKVLLKWGSDNNKPAQDVAFLAANVKRSFLSYKIKDGQSVVAPPKSASPKKTPTTSAPLPVPPRQKKDSTLKK